MIKLFPPPVNEPQPDFVFNPLIQQLGHYDELRINIENRGGNLADLNRISQALAKQFVIYDRFGGETQVSLIQPELLQQVVFMALKADVHLSIRQTGMGMPVYYLCRIHRDFWSEYSLIVEDLYRSPGYPFLDERFVKLMIGAQEKYHLRVAQFRRPAARLLLRNGEASETRVDEVLYTAGRHIYQAAWHEDQLPAILCANYFSLSSFKQAVELLYVCLTAELCELRAIIDEDLLKFFKKIDFQPAIGRLLQILSETDGSTINKISEKALQQYTRLNKAFGRFLRIQVTWGERQNLVPLYKLVFSNFTRLSQISSEFFLNSTVSLAVAQLETEASAIIDEMLT